MTQVNRWLEISDCVQTPTQQLCDSRDTTNPLTTDDTKWRRLTLAACYQLMQSVLKIVFVLAKKVG